VVQFYDKAIKGRSPTEEGEEKDWNIHPNWVPVAASANQYSRGNQYQRKGGAYSSGTTEWLSSKKSRIDPYSKFLYQLGSTTTTITMMIAMLLLVLLLEMHCSS